MDKETALLELKEKSRMKMQSTLSCIQMFLRNREQCGVKTDESFIKWLDKKIKDDKREHEEWFTSYERQFPD